jgi:plastocyanin
MRLRGATPLILILAALSLAACGSDGSGSDSTAEGEATVPSETTGEAGEAETAPSGEAVRSAKVEIADFAYAPETVTIQAGGKVTWQNEDADAHTATLDDGSFSTGDLAEGKLKSESFKDPGTFTYHCEIHPEMTGTVEVVEPS